MKRILYLHQYFMTPAEGGTLRSYHIAKGLVDRGMEVEMITSHNKPSYEKKQVEGIEVHYLPVGYSSNYSYGKRVYSFVRFVSASLKLIKQLPQADLVYATSTPLTVGIIALWLKWRQSLPYIFEVRDLWPEAPIQLKIIRSKLVIQLAEYLENRIYRNSSTIIALSPGIEKGILTKHPKANTVMIPNMADLEFFNLTVGKPKKMDHFMIGYFGAFGISNQVDSILDIAKACEQQKLPVRFVLAGQGPDKQRIEELAKELSFNSIVFHRHLDRLSIRKLMDRVDAVITSFKDIPILRTNSPNKFFDGLAAGKLIIVNTSGWLKSLIEENKCGFYTDQQQPDQFPGLIKPFIDDLKLLSAYQHRARKLAEEQFSKERLVSQVCDLVIES